MEIQLHDNSGKVSVAETVFGCDFNETLVHQVVVTYMGNARQDLSHQKTRSEVRGGGAKPWKQKGTGRARAGTIRSPIWRTGGVTFASADRNYQRKLNRKMYRAAMRSILSELLRQERLIVVEQFNIEAPKTKLLADFLKSYEFRSILLISTEIDSNLYLASRNLPHVQSIDVAAADPVALVGVDKVVITKAALKQFEEILG